MAKKLVSWALKQDVDGAMKNILIALANRADGATRQCSPSLTEITDDIGVDRRNRRIVTRGLMRLEYRRKIRRERPDTQRTVYTLLLGTTCVPSDDVRTRDTIESLPTRDKKTPDLSLVLGTPKPSPAREEKKVTKEKKRISTPIHNSNTEDSPFPSRRPAARDEAADIFADVFRNLHGPAEYVFRKGDWVWLANIRKALHLGPKSAPDFWRESCTNYLASPMGKHTLSDLCSRYEVFLKSGVDRYNKPNGGDYAQPQQQTNGDVIRQNSERLRARLDQQDRLRGERENQRRDNGRVPGTVDLPFDSADGSGHDPDD